MTNIIDFPSEDKRPEHTYAFKNCAGCNRPIGKFEGFTEVVMTSVDGMTVEHIALCDKCHKSAESYGVFD